MRFVFRRLNVPIEGASVVKIDQKKGSVLLVSLIRPVWFTPRDVRGSEKATLCVGQLFQLGFNLFFDLYRCSVQRLNWIFCESIWKQRHFRYNINEPYKCPGREILYTCTKSLNLYHYAKWFGPIVLHKINKLCV